MSFNPGTLENPWQGGQPPPPAPAPSGAVSPEHQTSEHIMEAPAFAASESDIARSVEQAIARDAPPAQAPAPGAGTFGMPWQQNPQPAAPAPAAPGSSGQTNWDSPDNPYRDEALRARPNQVRDLQTQLTNIPRHAADSVRQLVASGMSEEQATHEVTLAARALAGELRAQISEAMTEPAAAQMSAQLIAQRMSVPGVTIDPRQLLSEKSPDAMMARARTIVEYGRNTNVQTRASQGTDRVEAPATVSTGAGMTQRETSPFEDIKAGLRSQRR